MFALLVFIVLIYVGYRFYGRPTVTEQEEPTVGIIRDTFTGIKSDLAPVKEQVTTATRNAKQHYEAAKYQRQLEMLAANPKLLLDAVEQVEQNMADALNALPDTITPPPPPAQ